MKGIADYRAEMREWAAARGLRPSERPACAHGLTGLNQRDINKAEHRIAHGTQCKSVDLLRRAALWQRGGQPTLVTAACHRPGPAEPGYEAWAERLAAYCRPYGLSFLVVYREAVPSSGEDCSTVLYARSERVLHEVLGHTRYSLTSRRSGITIVKSGALW